MAGITQNKRVPYFHCSFLKNVKKNEKNIGITKTFKSNKTACK